MAQPSPRSPRWITIVSLAMVAVFVFGLVAVTQATLDQGSARRAPMVAFAPNNLVVVRVGAGDAALNTSAAPVFLDEYTQTGTAVQSINLPTTVSGANRRLTLTGTAANEGALNLSTNGQYLTLAGYDANVGTANVSTGTSSTVVNRVVARVDSNGVVDTTTVINDGYTFGNISSAVTDDGTRFWTGGFGGTLNGTTTGGTRYLTFGNTGSTVRISDPPNSTRVVSIFNGQLYASSNSFTGGSFAGVNQVGTGLPTTPGQTTTRLPGVTSALNAMEYVFLDRSPAISGTDTLYVASQADGLLKYSFNGTTWTQHGFQAGNYTGVTGVVSGTQAILYATDNTGGSSLIKLVDTAAYNVTLTGQSSVLATAPANTFFRGVAFAPQAPVVPTEVPTLVPTFTPTTEPTIQPTITTEPTPTDTTATVVPGGCLRFTVVIEGAQEVPPVSTTATGSAVVDVNTLNNTLTYSITYSGLSSAETMAHIHGFAPRGAPANVLFGLPLGTTKTGVITYTDAQESGILAGQTYINIHSANFTGGEIRGQIDGTPLPCEVVVTPTVTMGTPVITATATMETPVATTTATVGTPVATTTATVGTPVATTTATVGTPTVTTTPLNFKIYLPLIMRSSPSPQ